MLRYAHEKYESIAMTLQQPFGRRVRYLRLMARMTQAQLAEKIDLSTTQLGYIEQGRSGTTFETIEQICYALNVTIRELFDFDFPKPDTG